MGQTDSSGVFPSPYAQLGSTPSSVSVRVTVVWLSSTSTVLRHHLVRLEQLLGELVHGPLVALEREEVVLPRRDHGAAVGLGERAGVVGDDVEEPPVGLEQARERRP